MGCEAWVGVIGGIVGSLATLTSTWLTHYLGSKNQSEIDKARKKLLSTMLNEDKYKLRKLDTLSHVIGADKEHTKTLLLSLGARASENGSESWGLITKIGLPSSE